MRRFFIIIGMLLPMFFLSACNNTFDINDKDLVLEFKSEFEINSEKTHCSAQIIRTSAEGTQIEFVEPENLKGLKICHNGKTNYITKDELTYQTDTFILPSSSEVVSVIEVIEYVIQNPNESPFYKDNKEMAFIGKIKTGKFELKAARDTGLITEIKIGDDTTIKFFNQEKL